MRTILVPLMLLLRFVAFALLPNPMISAVRMALLPLPFCPMSKFVRGLKSTVRFEWHMKLRSFTVKILPLRVLRFKPPWKWDDKLATESIAPSSCVQSIQTCFNMFSQDFHQNFLEIILFFVLTSSLESFWFGWSVLRFRFGLSWSEVAVDLRLPIFNFVWTRFACASKRNTVAVTVWIVTVRLELEGISQQFVY